MTYNASLFEIDGDTFIPTDFARGPWSHDSLHGGPVAALVARQGELCESPEPMHVARLTVELLRPVPLSPLHVETVISRPGRKLQVIDMRVRAQDVEVAWARAVRIRLNPKAPPGYSFGDADQQSDSLPAPFPGRDASAPPGPESGKTSNPIAEGYRGFHTEGAELRFVHGEFANRGPATVWVRLLASVVADEDPSGVQRAAAAADFGNGVSSVLDFERNIFINPDLTVYLHRPPQGEWICLDAATTLGTPGVGVAQSALWDTHGPVGTSLQSLVVEPR